MNQEAMVVLILLLLLGTTRADTNTQGCQPQLQKDTTYKYCHLLEKVQSQLNQLKEKLNELSNSQPLPDSCAEIKAVLAPCSLSGYYEIQANGAENQTVYCNMDELCGENGGWMRVGHLNMTDSNETCPEGFQTHNITNGRSCGRSSSTLYCQSVMLPSHGVNYTQVCGRVTGHQTGTTDAFEEHSTDQRGNIEAAYVDGVSITRGSPRNHVWTYIVIAHPQQCPACNEGYSSTTPSFVGNDYFCESDNDLLWDGEQCGSIQAAACCQASRDMPWFKKVLDTPSTDYLELRVCCDQNLDDEDVRVNYYEIYIK